MKQITLIHETYKEIENHNEKNGQFNYAEKNTENSDDPSNINSNGTQNSPDQSNCDTDNSNLNDFYNFNKNITIRQNKKYNDNLSNNDISEPNKNYDMNNNNNYSENPFGNQTQYHSIINDSKFNNNEDITDELNYNPNSPLYRKTTDPSDEQLHNWEQRIKKVRFENNYNNANIVNNDYSEFALSSINGPKSFKSAIKSNDSENWRKSINDELDSIYKNDVWQIINKPKNANIIST